MSQTNSALPGQLIQLQSAATSGAGTVIVPSPLIKNHTVILVGTNATFSTGKSKVESSHDPSFAGTWALEGTEQTLVQNAALNVTFTGPRAAIRANISASITGGGALNAYYIGN
jgi:hypothetical protein